MHAIISQIEIFLKRVQVMLPFRGKKQKDDELHQRNWAH